MKIITIFIKCVIDFFSFFIKKSADSQKYLFSVALKKEVSDYVETGYYVGYKHIEKSIDIAKKYLGNHDDFLIADVGGSIGVTAEYYLKAFPKASLYVFEPIKENYSHLKERLKGGQNVFPINKALGNAISETEINVAKRISSSSLFELNVDPTNPVFPEALAHERKEKIQISTLDNELPKNKRVLILKMDVQGFELEVLKGGEDTIKRTSVITLEMNNHEGYLGSPKYFEIDEYLRKAGFCLYDMLPSTRYNGLLVEWDCIYINQDLL
jgi:FkbM family methyltransferase